MKRDKVRKTTPARQALDKTLTLTRDLIINDSRKKQTFTHSAAEGILNTLSRKGSEIKSIKEILPDLNLIGEILVSSIINPKDFTDIELDISLKIPDTDDKVVNDISTILNNHFNDVRKLSKKLPEIITEALVDYGSFTYIILPTGLIKNVIEKSTQVGMESLLTDLQSPMSDTAQFGRGVRKIDKAGIEIEFNLGWLYAANARQKIADSSINTMLAGLEGEDFKTVVLDGTAEVEDSYPVVKKIPHDAILPIHDPSDPSDHLAYFIILDEHGYPVSKIKDGHHAEKLKQLDGNSDALKKALRELGINQEVKTSNELINAYFTHVDKEIEDALKATPRGENIAVSNPENVYSIMLSRALAKKKTKLLYVDKSLVTYFAYDYTPDGVGESLIEKTKLYASLRATLMVAELMSAVKRSTPRTKLNIQLDENDPDPIDTVTRTIAEFTQMQNAAFPLGEYDLFNIFKSLQHSGVVTEIDGNSVFPGTKTSIESTERETFRPDPELSERLMKIQYNAMGVPPEIVDRIFEGEFATGIVTSNKHLARRIKLNQEITETHITDHVKKYVIWAGKLQKELLEAAGNKDGIDINAIVNGISVKFPSPDTTKIKANLEALTEYRELVGVAVDNYITEDMLADIAQGETLPDGITSVRELLITTIVREWMRDQNILPEIDILLSNDSEYGFNERITEHIKIIADTIGTTIRNLKKVEDKQDEKTNNVIEKLEQPDEEEEIPGDTPTEEPTEPSPDGEIPPEEDVVPEGDTSSTDDIPEEF